MCRWPIAWMNEWMNERHWLQNVSVSEAPKMRESHQKELIQLEEASGQMCKCKSIGTIDQKHGQHWNDPKLKLALMFYE